MKTKQRKPTFYNRVSHGRYLCCRCHHIKVLDEMAFDMVINGLIYCEKCKREFLK